MSERRSAGTSQTHSDTSRGSGVEAELAINTASYARSSSLSGGVGSAGAGTGRSWRGVKIHPVFSLGLVASAPPASKEARVNNVMRNYT
jgi:hypothetical protein